MAWQTTDGYSPYGDFALVMVYKAMITLTAKAGYTFIGMAANSFRYYTGTTAANAADSGEVTITFPETAPILLPWTGAAATGFGSSTINGVTYGGGTIAYKPAGIGGDKECGSWNFTLLVAPGARQSPGDTVYRRGSWAAKRSAK